MSNELESMKMAVFWVVAPCSLVEVYTDILEVLAASIIALMAGLSLSSRAVTKARGMMGDGKTQ
jgi:hypothetical protein